MSERTRLIDLILPLGVEPGDGWGEVYVTGICEDSRRVSPGDFFVAIPGAKVDGASYAEDAVERGAVGIVAERPIDLSIPCVVVPDARRALALLSARFFDEPTRDLHAIGVTGTNGKTTVCHWIAHLLEPDRCEVISTVENERRGIRAVTTPPSPSVQRIAREAQDAGRRHLIVEASSIGLEQHRLDAVEFDVGVFTNLTHDHLDLHGDLASYRAAKSILFEGLTPDAWAVVNGDDASHAAMLEATQARSFVVSRNGSADLSATVIDVACRSEVVRLVYRGEENMVKLPAGGLHSVDNALVAAGAALCSGVPLSIVVERLGTVPPIPGRGEVYRNRRGVTAVVDFAHNPDALERTLMELRPGFERILVVFGAPGESDRAKRPVMGRIAGRLADLTILTSDNPKGESPEAIMDEIESGVAEAGGACERVIDRAEAIARAVERSARGDLVLVAGKGHEDYQLVGEGVVPYADGAVLASLGFRPIDVAPEARETGKEK